jgi:hypothetical protein
MVYLLARATLEGLICEGPMEGRFATYVRVQDWLHPEPRPAAERVEDLDRLVRRYLDAYGPAAPEDLAVWSGLPVPECRDAFGRAGLTRVDAGGRTMFLTGEPAGGETPRVRLLPAFDTFLLGYRDRSLHLDPAFARTVNAGGGIVKPVVLVDGRVAGTWRPVRSPKAVRLSVHPFDDLPNESLGALQVEAQDVGRFLGLRPELTVSA